MISEKSNQNSSFYFLLSSDHVLSFPTNSHAFALAALYRSSLRRLRSVSLSLPSLSQLLFRPSRSTQEPNIECCKVLNQHSQLHTHTKKWKKFIQSNYKYVFRSGNGRSAIVNRNPPHWSSSFVHDPGPARQLVIAYCSHFLCMLAQRKSNASWWYML